MPTARVARAMPANLALAREAATRALRVLGAYDGNLARGSVVNQRVLRSARAYVSDAMVAASYAGKYASADELARAAKQLERPHGLRYARNLISHAVALLRM